MFLLNAMKVHLTLFHMNLRDIIEYRYYRHKTPKNNIIICVHFLGCQENTEKNIPEQTEPLDPNDEVEVFNVEGVPDQNEIQDDVLDAEAGSIDDEDYLDEDEQKDE